MGASSGLDAAGLLDGLEGAGHHGGGCGGERREKGGERDHDGLELCHKGSENGKRATSQRSAVWSPGDVRVLSSFLFPRSHWG